MTESLVDAHLGNIRGFFSAQTPPSTDDIPAQGHRSDERIAVHRGHDRGQQSHGKEALPEGTQNFGGQVSF